MHNQSRPASPQVAEENDDLGRGGSRNQVGGSQPVQELVARDPAPPRDHFVFHHGDVRGGAAKRGQAQTQEQPGDFGELR